MIAVQLSPEYETKIEQLAAHEDVTPSEIIQKALKKYFDDYHPTAATPYELGQDLFGRYGSGKGNLSQEYKKILKEKLHAKHAH